MRRVLAVAAATALIVVGSAALAQGGFGGGQGRRGGPGGGMGMRGGLMLLRVPKVQTELKMTQPQIDKLDPKQQEVMDAMREARQGFDFQNATDEDRAKMMQKTTAIQDKAVADILDTTQLKRFRQIEMQNAGPGIVLQRPQIAEQLKVTDAQKAQMRDVQTKARQEMMQTFQGLQNATPEERQAAMEKMRAAQKVTNEKMLAVLTTAQQAQWKQMCGTPFEMPAMQFGGRRRAQ